MGSLFIDRRNLSLELASGILRVRRLPDETIERDIPIALLDRVILRARCRLDSAVLTALAEQGVALIALHGRGGQRLAQILGSPHNDARRRWAQILALADRALAMRLAAVIVRAKLRRQKTTLHKLGKHCPEQRKALHDALQQLSALGDGLKAATSMDQIRGIEGAAAAIYFRAYFACFAPQLRPTGRTRRPPRDPVNAVLSLTYTLLYSQAVSACWSAGLDPGLGALHAPSHGRAALACDLMEPWRPRLDLWVWELFRSQTLRPEHFSRENSGAYLLGKAGRAHYWQIWNLLAPAQQRRLDRQAQALARLLRARLPQLLPQEWLQDTGE